MPGGKRNVLRPPPWDRGEVESASFGTWLRRQREAREISLRDIADRTKISLRYLEAMEDDRFDLLPAPIFAKGFLKEYARYVGLSPDDVVNHYLAVQPPEEPRPEQRSERRLRSSWTYGLVLGLGGLLLLALLTLLAFWAEHRKQSPAAAPPPIAPPAAAVIPAAAAPVAAPVPPPSAPIEVTLDFSQDCWVDALVDGIKRTAELHVQGESMQIDARESVVLTLGKPAAVEAQVNGYPLAFGNKAGEVLHDFKIDLDTVRALKEKKEGRR
jgi:cytoskeleton protein RodZ